MPRESGASSVPERRIWETPCRKRYQVVTGSPAFADDDIIGLASFKRFIYFCKVSWHTEHEAMIITDSGLHIWRAEAPDRPWQPGRTAHLPTPMGYDDLSEGMAPRASH